MSPSTLSDISPSQSTLSQYELPSPLRQLTFFTTGCLAGAASLPLSTTTILRTGIRFWTFDHTRHLLHPLHLPIWLSRGIGGAAGGFNEVLLSSLSQRRFPALKALGSQSLRLFFCFGTYTFLSTRFSERQPPKPFWKCWGMGAVAGATGSAVVGFLEGFRGQALWRGVVPRGALVIGTVISVQVSNSAKALEVLGI